MDNSVFVAAHFSMFVGGFISNKVKKCVVYFALFESCISKGQ